MCRYAHIWGVDEAKLCWVFPVIQKPATLMTIIIIITITTLTTTITGGLETQNIIVRKHWKSEFGDIGS